MNLNKYMLDMRGFGRMMHSFWKGHTDTLYTTKPKEMGHEMKWFNLDGKVQIWVGEGPDWRVGIVVEKQTGETYGERETLLTLSMKPNIAILLGRALINIGQHVGKRKYKRETYGGDDS